MSLKLDCQISQLSEHHGPAWAVCICEHEEKMCLVLRKRLLIVVLGPPPVASSCNSAVCFPGRCVDDSRHRVDGSCIGDRQPGLDMPSRQGSGLVPTTGKP